MWISGPLWGILEATGKVSEKKLLIFFRRDLSTKNELYQDNKVEPALR